MNDQKTGWFGKLLAFVGALASAVFLLNPTAGFIEIPDNLPVVGNLDEVVVSAILFYCLQRLGVPITLSRRGPKADGETIDSTSRKHGE